MTRCRILPNREFIAGFLGRRLRIDESWFTLIWIPLRCGIFGILASNCSISRIALEQATDSLTHRGPDDRGTVVLQAKATPCLEIVQSNNGVVVLSGSVETERSSAESAANQVEGVKGVINNLQRITAAVTSPLGQPQLAAQSGGDKQVPKPKPSVARPPSRSRRHFQLGVHCQRHSRRRLPLLNPRNQFPCR